MNLEEKAKKVEKYGRDETESLNIQFGYVVGYRECKSDLIDFLKANPKADNKQITEYLNSL